MWDTEEDLCDEIDELKKRLEGYRSLFIQLEPTFNEHQSWLVARYAYENDISNQDSLALSPYTSAETAQSR